MSTRISEILTDLRTSVKERVTEIYEYIHGEVTTDVELDLTSDSNVADWELWVGVMSIASKAQEDTMQQAKEDITAIKNSGIGANKVFFATEWKKFQYGDSLLIDDETKKYFYETLDSDKQIIKRLAISNGVNSWELRVAKEENDKPVKLTVDELNAFRSYVDATAPPGPIIPIISRDSDKVNTTMTVYYDPIVPLATLKPLVEAAYLEYIAGVDIEGESKYYVTRHKDAIQLVEGVDDVEVTLSQARPDDGTYATVNRIYEPISGYLESEEEDLDMLITYVTI